MAVENKIQICEMPKSTALPKNTDLFVIDQSTSDSSKFTTVAINGAQLKKYIYNLQSSYDDGNLGKSGIEFEAKKITTSLDATGTDENNITRTAKVNTISSKNDSSENAASTEWVQLFWKYRKESESEKIHKNWEFANISLSSSSSFGGRALVLDNNRNITSSAVTSSELAYLQGATGNIQTQISARATAENPTFSGTITTPLAASRVIVTNGSKQLSASGITTTTLNYLTDVTGNIQSQLNAKANDSGVVHKANEETISGNKTFSGNVVIVDQSPSIKDTSFDMNSSTTASYKNIINLDANGKNAGYIAFGGNKDARGVRLISTNSNGDYNGAFSILTNGSSTWSSMDTDNHYIDGNTRIGSSSAAKTLTVYGNEVLTGTLSVGTSSANHNLNHWGTVSQVLNGTQGGNDYTKVMAMDSRRTSGVYVEAGHYTRDYQNNSLTFRGTTCSTDGNVVNQINVYKKDGSYSGGISVGRDSSDNSSASIDAASVYICGNTTTTGNITIGNTSTNCVFRIYGNGSNIKSILTDMDSTVTPSSKINSASLAAYDKNSVIIGGISSAQTANGYVGNELFSSCSGNTCTIGAYVNSSGSMHTYAPTPATSDNSTKIATTAFVKNQGYASSLVNISSDIVLGNIKETEVSSFTGWTTHVSSSTKNYLINNTHGYINRIYCYWDYSGDNLKFNVYKVHNGSITEINVHNAGDKQFQVYLYKGDSVYYISDRTMLFYYNTYHNCGLVSM